MFSLSDMFLAGSEGSNACCHGPHDTTRRKLTMRGDAGAERNQTRRTVQHQVPHQDFAASWGICARHGGDFRRHPPFPDTPIGLIELALQRASQRVAVSTTSRIAIVEMNRASQALIAADDPQNAPLVGTPQLFQGFSHETLGSRKMW
jgi:hypothetical protein